MNKIVLPTPEKLGKCAASHAAKLINQYIKKQNHARILLSTGASQLMTLYALISEDVDWSKVEMFHLDEYINLPQEHPASFVKYLKERFAEKINLAKAHYVDTTKDIDTLIKGLTNEIRRLPIDVGLIGIGENAHIAFNDPPADFGSKEAYITVSLAESCRKQQLGEGWFPTLDDVPKKAVTITVHQILQCRHIISAVPFSVKATAVRDTFNAPEITPDIPSTALRQHDDVTVYLDNESASLLEF